MIHLSQSEYTLTHAKRQLHNPCKRRKNTLQLGLLTYKKEGLAGAYAARPSSAGYRPSIPTRNLLLDPIIPHVACVMQDRDGVRQ